MELELTNIDSGAMSLDQIPMVIETGVRAVFCQFDVWGVSRLMADSLAEGWKAAKSFEGRPRSGLENGDEKVVVNGKEDGDEKKVDNKV